MVSTLLEFFRTLVSRYSSGHARTERTEKNILAMLVLKGISILTGLLMVPLTLHYLNSTNYGIWITLSSIVGWLNFFDIGFGNGLRNRFAESRAKGDLALARIYISTTYAVLTALATAILVLFLLVNPFLNWSAILNTTIADAQVLSHLAIVVVASFAVRFVAGLISTVLIADQRPAISSLIDVGGNLLALGAIVVLTKFYASSLLAFGFVFSVAVTLVPLGASFWFYTRDYRIMAPSWKFVQRRYVRDLAALGIQFFIIQIGALVIFATGNVVIAQLFSPADVTSYNIAFRYFNIITMAFAVIVTPFWSAFTDAFFKNDLVWIRTVIKRLVVIWAALACVIVLMLVLADPFYALWVGQSISVPLALSAAMALYVAVLNWNSIYANFLNGTGRIRLQLYSTIVYSIVNIPLSILFAKVFEWGIASVVLSSTLCLLASAVWAPIQSYKLIRGTAQGIWAR